MSQRIGIFGGTFDPPHIGHLVAAVNVHHALALDRTLLVVANHPWQKAGRRSITSASDRLAMVQAAVEGAPGLEASSMEIDRGGDSYTADTLATLHQHDPDVEPFVVLGADAAAGMPSWERVDEVRAMADLVVVDREGVGPTVLPHGWEWTHVEVPRLEVSSTDLRERVADGRPLEYLVPPAVIACIRERHLYREPT